MGVIDANPFHEVDKEGYVPPARERCPTDAEFAAAYSIASDRMRIATDVALLIGLRKGGVLRLELGDVLEDGLRSQRPGKKTTSTSSSPARGLGTRRPRRRDAFTFGGRGARSRSDRACDRRQ
jgi:hypothetical protein